VEEVVLSGEEVGALFRAHGLSPAADTVAGVLRRTGGAPAAVALAVRELAELHRSSQGTPATTHAPVTLPLLAPGLVDSLLGAGAWRRLVSSGLELHRRSDGWYVAAGDPLGAGSGVSSDHRRAAAAWYADHGQLALAVRWLHACRDSETAAQLVAATLTAPDRSRRWAELGELDPRELEAVARSWSDDLVGRRPDALLALVRAVEFGMQARLRAAWLERLEGLVRPDSDAWMPLQAELVRELARQGKAREVHDRACGLLDRADDVSRARLLMAESLVDLLHQDAAAVDSAHDVLAEATALLRLNGEREWEADAWLSLGVGADLRAGRLSQAIEHMERALALCSPGTQLRGRVLTFLAEALSFAGRAERAEAAVREAGDLAAARDDPALTAYVAWSAAIVATRRGDLPAAEEQLRLVEAHRGEWYALPAGVAFHADAADLLATLGQYAAARTHLRVGRAHPASADHGSAFDLAELVLAARDGDPGRAAQLAERCARTPLTGWRVQLLHAWAEHRAGHEDRAHELVEQALAEADDLGHPEVVDACEPELALWARGVAGRSPATRRDQQSVLVRLCGEVSVEGPHGRRAPRSGAETTLLVTVAARQRAGLEDLLELLWPGEQPTVGRRRLRNTLNRLRGSVGDVLVRRAEQLTLAPGVEVDVHAVLRAAQLRHTVPELRVEAARRALTLVAGDLTGDSDPVLDELRDQLSLAVGVLADHVADAATSAGELADAADHLALARRLDRYDEARAVRLVHVLRALGRETAADTVLSDALRACAELGVRPSTALGELSAASA
jgi:DNA-binding SARP family transcriptional activator